MTDKMEEQLSIKTHCADTVSYSRLQNGMKVIDRIVLKNNTGRILTGLVLTVQSDPGIVHTATLHAGDIKDGGTMVLDDICVDISAEYLANLSEIQTGVLRITATAADSGFSPVTVSRNLTLLPYDQWEGVKKADELLACFCVPNHPDVKHIVQEAAVKMHEWTGNSSMNGYHNGDSERAKMQAAAIFEAIREKGISYALPPASFYESGQRIRMPEEIFSTGLATCMDTTMLYASCLESVGLRPLVILNRAHAYAGLWLDDESTSVCVTNDDLSILRKRNAEGINQMLPVETTCMDQGSGQPFDRAVEAAEVLLSNSEQFECYIDIHEARKLGIRPLPLRVRTTDGYVIIPPSPEDKDCRPDSLPSTDVIDMEGTHEVDKQIIWERKLLDLTLRNNLLNIHPRSILQLMNPDAQAVISALENGRSMQISGVPDGWEGQMLERGIFSVIPAADKMAAYADAEVRDGKLHTFIDDGPTDTRMNTIRDTAKRSLEENGANSLYLAVGALKWADADHGKAHYAPVLLIPCEIMRQTGSVSATGDEAVINLTLLEMLRENFGISVPIAEELPEKDGHTDVRLILNTVRRAVMDRKGWDVDPLVFLGNFTFSKFIIWNDIHTGQNVFDGNPVIGSFKSGALDRRVEPLQSMSDNIDDVCPPDRILLPLEADSSQIKAISDALDGRSFVMQGPPGTGKSQTITNIIANALYHGKRVLFVSEKKAALEVVQNRLESIGLGPYCLELHSNKTRKSLVLDKMAATLETGVQNGIGQFDDDARSVAEMRSVMNGHVSSIHSGDGSWLTFYNALSQYLAAADDIPFRGMPNSVMSGISTDKVRQLHAVVRNYAAAAGHVSMDRIRELLDLPLKNYTPKMADSLRMEMEKLLGTGNPLLLRLRSRQLPKMLGTDIWNTLGLKTAAARRDKVKRWHDSLECLRDYAIYNSSRTAMRSCGLGMLAQDYENGGIRPDMMPDFLMKSLHWSFIKDKASADPHISMFCGDLFENAVSDYREAEHRFMDSSRSEICRRMGASIRTLAEETANPELTILKKAMRNGARGMSLRTLFSKIPGVMPRLCPCMLMSPLSVSQYLMADADMFDIVIFDEASQMQTCEAVGSIGRGHSLIVAGDSKQLPPTTFFETLSFDMDNADREDMESVLEECTSLSVPSNTLRWHYRSRHESLIAFSNSKFYDNTLLTFPSTDDLTNKVTLQRVAGEYDRGGSRQNRKEAEAVVAEIKRRLEKEPDRSIGVITFSQPQQMAVEKCLEAILRKNPGLEQIAAAMDEPVFVKNLENVQGDERDVILFSVGYGADKHGRIPMNFGPLNQKGGWRRLNVAVTRARYEMKVFSSIVPDDIRVDYNTPKGVVSLRDFLKYASEGRASLEERTESLHERDAWVEKLASDLRREGLQVNTNVGSSDFRIDIAVIDPEKEGCYSYGIVCDGPNYASAPSAVDRELVRPSVLESLGWKIRRRWILDAWNDRDGL